MSELCKEILPVIFSKIPNVALVHLFFFGNNFNWLKNRHSKEFWWVLHPSHAMMLIQNPERMQSSGESSPQQVGVSVQLLFWWISFVITFVGSNCSFHQSSGPLCLVARYWIYLGSKLESIWHRLAERFPCIQRIHQFEGQYIVSQSTVSILQQYHIWYYWAAQYWKQRRWWQQWTQIRIWPDGTSVQHHRWAIWERQDRFPPPTGYSKNSGCRTTLGAC